MQQADTRAMTQFETCEVGGRLRHCGVIRRQKVIPLAVLVKFYHVVARLEAAALVVWAQGHHVPGDGRCRLHVPPRRQRHVLHLGRQTPLFLFCTPPRTGIMTHRPEKAHPCIDHHSDGETRPAIRVELPGVLGHVGLPHPWVHHQPRVVQSQQVVADKRTL